MTRRFHIHRCLLLFLVFGMAIAAQGASIRIKLDAPRQIKVGDEFHIEITTQDVMSVSSQNVPGAQVSFFHYSGSMPGKGRGAYTLHARTPGNYTFTVVGENGLKSNTVSYKIVDSDGKGGNSSPAQSNPQPSASISDFDNSSGPKFIGKGDGNLFMRASLSKGKAYEQEALVYTVKLYSSYPTIKFIGATTAPKFEGFVVEESKATDTQLHYETYNGKQYASAVIARYIIFPQMKGTLKIIGNTYTVSVEERFMYHDNFYGNMSYGKPLQLNVTPNDLSVEVLSLPEPKPANFSGGVGNFSITSRLDATDWKTNQPSAITYDVKGSGNLRYVQLPDLAAIYPSQLEVSSPQTEVKTSVDASNVRGSVHYEYTVTPLEEGSFRIPGIDLVFFNPETGKYETAKCGGYRITVGKGSASAKSQKKEKLEFDGTLLEGGALEKEHVPLLHKFSYWLCYIIPTVLLGAAMIVYRRHLKLAADVEGLRARRANRLAKRWLKKARKAMKEDNREAFNDALLNALWGYLGDKLKIKPSDLSRKNVSEVLSRHGIAQGATNHLIELIDEVEYSKYASAAGSASMGKILQQASEMLEELEDSFIEVTNNTASDEN